MRLVLPITFVIFCTAGPIACTDRHLHDNWRLPANVNRQTSQRLLEERLEQYRHVQHVLEESYPILCSATHDVPQVFEHYDDPAVWSDVRRRVCRLHVDHHDLLTRAKEQIRQTEQQLALVLRGENENTQDLMRDGRAARGGTSKSGSGGEQQHQLAAGRLE